jgi:predicted DCC family thiol-disulfide oxidoreductase YuxK
MKPLLVFDGECGFCRIWIDRWRLATGERVEYAPYQEVGDVSPEISMKHFAEAVHLRDADGVWSRGAEAVYRTLAYSPRGGAPLWMYRRIPGFAWISELGYRFVAAHRPGFLKLTHMLWGRHPLPPGMALTTWIFVRLLAVVYLVAFVSAGTQIVGLAGTHGVLPAGEYLAALRTRYGALGFWIAPTLGWISTSDGFLTGMCVAGSVISVLLAIGITPLLCLALLWILYVSVSALGQSFFWFQWDSLLLETGLLAMLVAPRRFWSGPWTDPRPSRAGRWLLVWLLFRLSLSSAAVKLLSGDPTWRNATALQFHFQTQPLPPWTAWFVHHSPAWLLRAATPVTIALEGLPPFLLFLPRRIRFIGVGFIVSLQLLILLTGNYGFFNWLTLALCVLCLDDGVWPSWLRSPVAAYGSFSRAPSPAGRWRGRIRTGIAAALFLLSLVPFFQTLHLSTRWLGPIDYAFTLVWPFRSLNQYGLFAVMTTARHEIVLEGSVDGTHWLPYEFRWKPGDPVRRPEFVAPHQPRLDWQMWFAALTDFRQQPWFLQFCRRLLEGSRPVEAQLASNPFARAPPKYIRALLYDYQFTDSAEHRSTGAWWRRELLGLYAPILSLQNGQLVAVGGASE